MIFAAPWAFLLLPIVAWDVWRRSRRPSAFGFGSLEPALATDRSWRQRWARLPLALRAAGLAALVLALARPQARIESVRESRQGIAIQLLLDLSSSMDEPFDLNGKTSTRLAAAKKVLQEFVVGNGRDLPGRPQDLIGLITFARYADTVAPLTLNHAAIASMIEEVRLGARPLEDATAFGDAVALAAAHLKEQQGGDLGIDASRGPVKTKVIVLLTDGENNAGRILPLQAASLAKDWGIRIYTIMLQSPSGPGAIDSSNAQTNLAAIAEATGGVFRPATDFGALDAVYREIDRLERSPVSTVRFVEYRERFARFAAPGLILLALGELLASLVFREASG